MSTKMEQLQVSRKEIEKALKELEEKELDEEKTPIDSDTDSDGDGAPPESTPPLRRLQKMLEDTKVRYGDFEKGEVPEFGDVSEKPSENSSGSGGKAEVEILLGEKPDCVRKEGVRRNAYGAVTVQKTENQGNILNDNQNVKNTMSWKDILTGEKSDTCEAKVVDAYRVVKRADSVVANENSEIFGTGTSGTVGKRMEPRPGARSNVPLWFCSFTPGSPVNDLVTDAGTVEKLNNCIVGHFLGARMDYYDVRKEMFHQWESCRLEKMWCTDNGIYLFKFKVTNKIDEILEEAHCHVFGKVMVLKRWHQMQKISKEAVFKVPIWVKIYELSFEFWLRDSLGENLSKIASRIGRPLYMDTATEKGMRLSYARVCVEIDVSALLPDSINIEFGGESVEVKVQYQWVPKKCEKCGAFGHKGNYCPLNPKDEECGENKRAKAKASTDYGGRTKGGNSGRACGKDWKVVHKGIWENRVGSINNSEVELDIHEGNKILSSVKHGKKVHVKGNLAKDKGHLKSGNSFAVLQSLQGENHGMNINRGRKDLDAIGVARVEKTDGDNVAGGVDTDKDGEMIDKDSCYGRNPEEDIALFDVFATGRDAEGLGIVTPKPKKIWTENDFLGDWGNSKRRKAAKAANLAGPDQNDPP